jgi:hypothetical protein
MERPEFESLQARLHRVERRMRLVLVGWIASAVALVLLGVVAGGATSQPEVLRAQAVEVVDAAGKTRIALHVRQGVAVVRLADRVGQSRIEFAVFPDEYAGVQLSDGAGRPRIRLSVDSGGAPALWLFDALARHRLGLKVLSDGGPRLWLLDATTGQVRFQAP